MTRERLHRMLEAMVGDVLRTTDRTAAGTCSLGVLEVHLIRLLLKSGILAQKLHFVFILHKLIIVGEWLVANLVGPLVGTPEVVLAIEGHYGSRRLCLGRHSQ